MRSAHPLMTVYIRANNKAHKGRADVAGVPLVAIDGKGPRAYFGEVSGEEVVIGALVADVVPSDTSVADWLASHGYRLAGEDDAEPVTPPPTRSASKRRA